MELEADERNATRNAERFVEADSDSDDDIDYDYEEEVISLLTNRRL